MYHLGHSVRVTNLADVFRLAHAKFSLFRRQTRKHVLYANTQFTNAMFDPSGVQVIATGTNRRISYWEVFDASLVRDIEGSSNGAVNSLSINSTGEVFATAGNDQIIKLWNYETGLPLATGTEHAAPIVTCKFSPCGRFLLSGSSDGAVIVWKIPQVSHSNECKRSSSKLKLPIDCFQEFWPKTDVKPFGSLHLSTKKASKYERKPEDIKQLESSRSNKSVYISECPACCDNKNTQKIQTKAKSA